MLEKPFNVQRARLNHDRDALVRMGKKGAKASAEKRHEEQQLKDFRAAERAEELLEARYQSNEHILSPEGEDGEFPDGIILHE